jgi:hypothetical protein
LWLVYSFFLTMQASPSAMSESSTLLRRSTSSKEFPKRSVMGPSSPFKASSNEILPEGNALHRLYKAPLALVRRSSIHEAPAERKPKPKTGSTRRRRRPSITQTNEGTGFVRQGSSSSLIEGMARTPSTPPVWPADNELGSSVPDYAQRIHPRFRHRPSQHLQVSHGFDDSEYLDDESHSHSHYESQYGVEEGPFFRMYKYKGPHFSNILQLMIILVLGVIVYDSNHKNSMHKAQLQQYDEERSHILEQMMWIDKAAKKVHKKYTNESLLKDIESADSEVDLRQDVEGLRDEMQQLQRRIQLNARGRINERFGDKPMQVSLSLGAEGSKHVTVALSDDTPHAAGTWLQQIDKKMWDDVIFETTADSVQISTRMPDTSPLLEFVEKSRRCREIGSVAVRQLENMELHVLVLRIALKEDTPMDESDVCIGRVVGGLDELRLLPQTVQHEGSSIPL